jgi:hypothetical protein
MRKEIFGGRIIPNNIHHPFVPEQENKILVYSVDEAKAYNPNLYGSLISKAISIGFLNPTNKTALTESGKQLA